MNDEDLRVRFGENGKLMDRVSPRDFVLNTFLYCYSQVDLKYASLESLKENFHACIQASEEYCREVYASRRMLDVLGIQRGGITRLVRKMSSSLKFLEYQSRESFLSMFFDFILSLEGLGCLRNFGIGNLWGDVLHGNPEKMSIRLAKSRRMGR